MTNFQQALLHLATVVVAVAAVVALSIAGDLTTAATYVILGVTGFTNIGIAGTTSTTVASVPVTQTPTSALPQATYVVGPSGATQG